MMEETRWQAFRRVNRTRRLKQLRTIAVACAAAAVYCYVLIGWHRDLYSFEGVVERNTIMTKRYHKQQLEREEKLRLERLVRANITRARREQRREQLDKERQEAASKRQNVTDTTSLGTNHTSKLFPGKQAQQQPSEVVVFLRAMAGMLAFTSAVGMVRMMARRVAPRRTRPRRLTLREQRQAAFRAWANRLNQQRVESGERPISLESLRLVLRNRDLRDGNDYDALLQFSEEAGPAMEALLQSMGATAHEIERCPHRTLEEGDELLLTRLGKSPPHCAVCLETYQLHDQVRTIPCFHTFHTRCIDPWLAQKAVCPVCKHSALA